MINGPKYPLINGFWETIKINGKLMEIFGELMEINGKFMAINGTNMAIYWRIIEVNRHYLLQEKHRIVLR